MAATFDYLKLNTWISRLLVAHPIKTENFGAKSTCKLTL
jgi:hypothetical protein